MHPVLFSLGDTPIHAYGFLIAVALILGWILSLRLARLDKLPVDHLGTGYVLSVAGGLFVARFMWLTQNDTLGLAELLQLQAGGLSGFGGVLTGLIIAGVYCQNKKIPPWAWLDCAAPAFLIGLVLERTAAFLAGANFGHYVDPDFWLAVQFPADSLVYDWQRRELAGMRLPVDQSLPVHPSQLYAAVAASIAAGLSFLVRARRSYSGQVALFALASFAVVRYLIEDPFRHDMTPHIAGPVSLGHITAVVAVAVAVAAHVTRSRKAQDDPAAYRQWLGGPWTPDAEGEAGPSSKKKSSKKKSSKKSSKKGAAKPKSADGKPKSAEAKPKTDAKSDAKTDAAETDAAD
jgi:phosphatidylglycerol---prolipoprotein diacylglyceryl transferase